MGELHVAVSQLVDFEDSICVSCCEAERCTLGYFVVAVGVLPPHKSGPLPLFAPLVSRTRKGARVHRYCLSHAAERSRALMQSRHITRPRTSESAGCPQLPRTRLPGAVMRHTSDSQPPICITPTSLLAQRHRPSAGHHARLLAARYRRALAASRPACARRELERCARATPPLGTARGPGLRAGAL